jgi:hypothetical protein
MSETLAAHFQALMLAIIGRAPSLGSGEGAFACLCSSGAHVQVTFPTGTQREPGYDYVTGTDFGGRR